MIDLIHKLKERKILQVGSMISTEVQKFHLGTPMRTRAILRIREIHDNHCVADEEYAHSESPVHKIDYLDIVTIDGMKPGDLAAVYGLGPKTSRFKKDKRHK